MKDNTDLLKLSIPGLAASYNKNQTLGLKIIWVMMVITCTAICIKLIIDRVLYFFTYPVTLTYEMGDSDFQQFPKATFCPKSVPVINCSTEKTHVNAWDDLEEPFYKLFDIGVTSEGSTGCLETKYWTKHETVFGSAYTFDTTNFINISIWFIFLQTKEMEIKNWKVLLHDDDADIAYGCATDVYPITKDNIGIYMFSKSLMIYQNVPPRLCQSLEAYKNCINRCMDLEILKNSNCKLPFMASINNLPLCQTCEQISAIYQNFDEKNIHNTMLSCNCTKSCQEIRYSVDLDTREKEENETQFAVFLPRDEVEFLREKRSYEVYALICEIGGIIGLYLGACLMTFIEIVQVSFSAAYKRILKPAGKPFVRILIEMEPNKITRRYVNYASDTR